MERVRNNWTKLFIAAITLIYLFLPNNNSTLDAYDYANSVKHGMDLFHPHHLLFNAFFYVVSSAGNKTGLSIDPLRLIKSGNALFALGALLLTYIILKKQCGKTKAETLTAIAACSFGMLRFSTEGETYILPLFFCVLSSLFFLKSEESKGVTYTFLSALSSVTAILFHQTALLWGIGIFIGHLLKKKKKEALLFAGTTLIVPLAYSAALVWYQKTDFSIGNLMRYIASYYQSDSADISISWVNFLLTPISLVRTFIQVHGNIPIIFTAQPAYLILASAAILFLILAIRARIKGGTKKPTFTMDFSMLGKFEATHLAIFILSLSFAFFSHGNAEFMVMLPICIALAFHPFMEEANTPSYTLLAYAFGCWNIGCSILPNHQMDFYHDEEVISHIESHPDAVYLLTDKNAIRNKYFYNKGKEPQAILTRYDKEGERETILKETQKGKKLFTDAATKNIPFSRTSILERSAINYKTIRHDKKIEGDLGSYYIDEIELE